MKLLKFFAILTLLIMSFFPLILSSVYLFTGGDRQAFLDLLNKIPKENFWLFAVPLLIICYACTCWLFWKLVDISVGTKKPELKEIYYLEDDHLGEKLQGLISKRPGTYEEDVMSTIELDENFSGRHGMIDGKVISWRR